MAGEATGGEQLGDNARLTLRRPMIVVAVIGLGHGVTQWLERLGTRSAYDKFAAGAYDLESKNHGMSIRFYGTLGEERRRPNILPGTG